MTNPNMQPFSQHHILRLITPHITTPVSGCMFHNHVILFAHARIRPPHALKLCACVISDVAFITMHNLSCHDALFIL